MEMLEAYYKDQVTASDWMLPDDDENKILALQAEMAQMIKDLKSTKQGNKHPPRNNMGNRHVNDRERWKLIPPR
jgi:hypothetical protein